MVVRAAFIIIVSSTKGTEEVDVGFGHFKKFPGKPFKFWEIYFYLVFERVGKIFYFSVHVENLLKKF